MHLSLPLWTPAMKSCFQQREARVRNSAAEVLRLSLPLSRTSTRLSSSPTSPFVVLCLSFPLNSFTQCDPLLMVVLLRHWRAAWFPLQAADSERQSLLFPDPNLLENSLPVDIQNVNSWDNLSLYSNPALRPQWIWVWLTSLFHLILSLMCWFMFYITAFTLHWSWWVPSITRKALL